VPDLNEEAVKSIAGEILTRFIDENILPDVTFEVVGKKIEVPTADLTFCRLVVGNFLVERISVGILALESIFVIIGTVSIETVLSFSPSKCFACVRKSVVWELKAVLSDFNWSLVARALGVTLGASRSWVSAVSSASLLCVESLVRLPEDTCATEWSDAVVERAGSFRMFGCPPLNPAEFILVVLAIGDGISIIEFDFCSSDKASMLPNVSL